ncbi:SDR family oxidoreductase [Sphingobacterium deserti]|uniref:Short-chain dehydrogenase/reductase SDR n=1 Tax=Sphingobacterium deserti TaxID=1229276 RepID=A0A0B8T460_9SPHI|nr:SDR family oxidoreductase [Sphingobacterium deserti]KGE16201.1 short-chain dehydrogenase/reductase SDR [Sphingobacterium deserti]
MKEQKTWFITGASRGFGLALTKRLLLNGDRVIATSRSIEVLRSQVANDTDNFLPLQVDLTSDLAVKEAVDYAIDRFEKLDVVVNNAGYALIGSVEEMSDEEFRATVDVNLFATVNVLRYVIPHFRSRRAGHIINISSIAGYSGIALASSYSASKFAVVGLTESLMKELADFDVKVTLVAPGEFRTSFMDDASIRYVSTRVPEYLMDQTQQAWSEASGEQPGDPEKLVEVLDAIAHMDLPPQRLILGPDAYQLFIEQQRIQEEEVEKYRTITLSTDFDND